MSDATCVITGERTEQIGITITRFHSERRGVGGAALLEKIGGKVVRRSAATKHLQMSSTRFKRRDIAMQVNFVPRFFSLPFSVLVQSRSDVILITGCLTLFIKMLTSVSSVALFDVLLLFINTF
jgi:hypothetical protein